jgi:hypothetical protein
MSQDTVDLLVAKVEMAASREKVVAKGKGDADVL